MAENSENGRSPLRRNRPSPRKHPYERATTNPSLTLGGGGPAPKNDSTTTIVRSPLKNIQAPLGTHQPHPLKPGLNLGGGVKSSPNKTKGKQILEYLQLGQGQSTTRTTTTTAATGPHPLQPHGQGGLHQTHRPTTATSSTIKIYTEEDNENEKPPPKKGVEGLENKSSLPLGGKEQPLVFQNILRRDVGVIGDNRRRSSTSTSTGGGGNSSFGFIPVDKSCVIVGGGSEIHTSGGSGGSIFNVSSSSAMSIEMEEESDNATPFPLISSTSQKTVGNKGVEQEEEESWNPFSSVNVTQGVLGTLQPRGLNSSFTEKFESRLGIDSGSKLDQSTGAAAAAATKEPEVKKEDPAAKDPGLNDENVAPVAVGRVLAPSRPPFGGCGRGGGGSGHGLLLERISPLFGVPEYVEEILRYWAKLELRFRIKADYMERHTGISHKMRTILVDWLVEVVGEYDLNEETLHLTVNYIDRFLCRMNVKRTKLQLVGAAALFIAAKFEEMSPPEVADFVFVTDEAYTKEEIIAMENLMLTCLEFDLMMPTAHNLALSYCSLLEMTDPGRSLSMYLVDLSLMEGEIFLKFLPSVVAGAAVALARFSFGGSFWDGALQKHCGHRKSTVIPAVRALHSAFFDAPSKSQSSIYEKYGGVRYCSVSKAFIPNNGPWDVAF